MAKYNLLTLDADKIVSNDAYRIVKQEDNNWKVLFQFDLSEKSLDGREVIISEKAHEDNALFYQIKKCIEDTKKNTEDNDKNLLRQSLIFIDFKKVFQGKSFDSNNFEDFHSKKPDELKDTNGLEYRLRWLFQPDNGIQLSFDGVNWKTFVPFDKSGNMARSSLISFIDRTLKEQIDKRLLLDIDFSNIKVISSKYYAYRGLYLSTGFRIEQRTEQNPNFIFDHESVIVIPDKRNEVFGKVFTASKPDADKDNEDILWNFFTETKCNRLNTFDGEGLICPEYAGYINNQLKSNYNFEKDSHSFQTRMPFTKGVLHEVDFNKFFVEQIAKLGKTLPDKLLIEDIFHIKRDLRKARIILTESMFKCCGWLTDLLRIWKESSTNANYDPMKYFFEKIALYNHALYVTNTDARLSSTGKIPLNYQFLSTLDISQTDFASIVREHIAWIKNLPHSFENRKDAVLEALNSFESIDSEVNQGEDESLELENLTNIREKCLKALALNKAFLKEPKIQGIITEAQRAYQNALCIGRLEITGEQRFLSSDLLELLRFIYQNITNITMDRAQLLELRKQRLYSNHFYLPEKRMKLKADKYYGFLRNPHLARNEQCLLRPYVKSGNLYERYFSHLKGIVMLSCESLVPMGLGGADFDGDLVKIVSDHRIVDAIKRSGYILTPKGYEKNLPVIEIPSVKSSPVIDSGSIPFKTVKNTFSNQIGLISNQAVKIAKKEYGPEGIEKEDIEKGNCCAGCTIITGLEIDAAKSGVHPKANISMLLNKDKNEPNIFLDAKKALRSNFLKNYTPKVMSNPNNTLSLYLTKDAKKPLMSEIPLFAESEPVSNIDRLPGEFLRLLSDGELSSRLTISENVQTNQRNLFKFQEDVNWKSYLDKDKKNQVKSLIEAYIKIRTLARLSNLERKNALKSNYLGHINTILKIQYDSVYQKLPCGVSVDEARNQAYATLKSVLEDSVEVMQAVECLKKAKWQYTLVGERRFKISKILGKEVELLPAVTQLLSNFSNNGFMIFYYMLKDIQNYYSANIDADAFIKKEAYQSELEKSSDVTMNTTSIKIKSRPDFNAPKDNLYYQELYDIYSSCSAFKKTDWNLDIVEKCREYLMDLFEGNMDLALRYIYSSSGKDTQHNFLWNVLTGREILRNINVSEL